MLSNITFLMQILWGVENHPLPLTKPVAANTWVYAFRNSTGMRTDLLLNAQRVPLAAVKSISIDQQYRQKLNFKAIRVVLCLAKSTHFFTAKQVHSYTVGYCHK